MNAPHNAGVSRYLGDYSDAVSVDAHSAWLSLSGVAGFTPDGVLPDSFAEQAENAWDNVKRVLHGAGFDVSDLVKVTSYLTDPGDVAAHREISARAVGMARPSFMLLIVSGLARPDVRIEIEAWAARGGYPHKDAAELAREAVATSDLGHRDSDEEDAYLKHLQGRTLDRG
jgi:enamine deaminase RidA (YjgF/YER057c/UK114 family)